MSRDRPILAVLPRIRLPEATLVSLLALSIGLGLWRDADAVMAPTTDGAAVVIGSGGEAQIAAPVSQSVRLGIDIDWTELTVSQDQPHSLVVQRPPPLLQTGSITRSDPPSAAASAAPVPVALAPGPATSGIDQRTIRFSLTIVEPPESAPPTSSHPWIWESAKLTASAPAPHADARDAGSNGPLKPAMAVRSFAQRTRAASMDVEVAEPVSPDKAPSPKRRPAPKARGPDSDLYEFSWHKMVRDGQ